MFEKRKREPALGMDSGKSITPIFDTLKNDVFTR
jgi:hypothetical protein